MQTPPFASVHRAIAFYFAAVLASFLLFGASAYAVPQRLIIEFKNDTSTRVQTYQEKAIALNTRLERVAKTHSQPLKLLRPFSNSSAVVTLNTGDDVQQVMQRLKSDADIRSVRIDRRVRLYAQSPLPSLLSGLDSARQTRAWFHQTLANQPTSINTGALWANFHGTSPTVVAVLDTGVLPNHPMLRGHLLPGYDFVSVPLLAADSQNTTPENSRDADPTDPGDAITAKELQADLECGELSNSSWHGTFVSALLAGNSVPSEGIFSVNPNASILPVRVLGKCGGYASDIADAIRWSAGLPVNGVPSNPFPARIINLSLGILDVCDAEVEGQAVLEARQAGSLVIAATGNTGGPVGSPANCSGAFAVGAVDQTGLKAYYSNFGSTVQLSAPGGDENLPIWSASNSGTSGPAVHGYEAKIGTSFAAPMVSAAAAAYFSLNPNATIEALEQQLKSTSRPFRSIIGNPTCTTNQNNRACNCTTALCGAGMLDIHAFIQSSKSAGLTNLYSTTGNTLSPSEVRQFSAAGSFNANGAEVSSVVFDVINLIKSNPSASNPVLSISGLTVNVSAPNGVDGFNLRATTANGRTAVVPIVISSAAETSSTLLARLLSSETVAVVSDDQVVEAESTTPPPSSGGGGGALNWSVLFLLVVLFLLQRNGFSLQAKKS